MTKIFRKMVFQFVRATGIIIVGKRPGAVCPFPPKEGRRVQYSFGMGGGGETGEFGA
jgi:hypothetical protein